MSTILKFGIAVLAALVTFGCAEIRRLPDIRTYETMVQAGNYQNVSTKITSALVVDERRFTVDGLLLRSFDQELSTAEVLTKLAKDHQAPATFEELLAYNAVHPNDMRDGSVAALGSPVLRPNGSHMIPSAYEDEHGRRSLYLAFDGPKDRWHTMFKFLVRQK